MKKILYTVLIVIATVLVVVLGYAAYVLISYHRIPDNEKLEIDNSEKISQTLITGQSYTVLTYNIGFGAYTQDYSFFMDGGTESWAKSPEGLEDNINKIIDYLKGEDADFMLLQEVDKDGTRTYHLDEENMISSSLCENGFCSTFALNYDSPFLFYPFTQPHGANKSGLLTFSKFEISDSLRRSLPIEENLWKLVDLDRCYSVNRIPTENGKELILYNIHLSAYTSNGTVSNRQLEMLIADMQSEYEAGNYCIAGGDFNKDLSGDWKSYFHFDSDDVIWALPIPDGIFDGSNISLVFAYDEENPVASCRHAGEPYSEDLFVVTVDGFLVSENIKVESAEVADIKYEYSDHNPVKMSFTLQ